MDGPAVLSLYDASVRADPPAAPGVERRWFDGVLRTTGAYNFIAWWDFPDEAAVEIVAREAAYFRGLGGEVEWKVYSHDRPPGLEALLAEAGFVADEAETFLVLDLEGSSIEAQAPPGIEIRRVNDEAGFADNVAVAGQAFDRPWPQDEVRARLADPNLALFVAYADDKAVGAGRLEASPGRAFAGLWGGAVAPAFRGKGIYRALVASRVEEAARRGCRFVAVDARETSRPILQRLGFEPLAGIRGWVSGRGAS